MTSLRLAQTFVRAIILFFLVNRHSLKLGQNKKGQKKFLATPFVGGPVCRIFFLRCQLKKDSKSGAAGKFFGPSFFVMALVCKRCQKRGFWGIKINRVANYCGESL